jgi:hypothetical protein
LETERSKQRQIESKQAVLKQGHRKTDLVFFDFPTILQLDRRRLRRTRPIKVVKTSHLRRHLKLGNKRPNSFHLKNVNPLSPLPPILSKSGFSSLATMVHLEKEGRGREERKKC